GGHFAETGIGLPPSMWLSFDGTMCGRACTEAEQETAATAEEEGGALRAAEGTGGVSRLERPALEDADADAADATAAFGDAEAEADAPGSDAIGSFPLHAAVIAAPASTDAPRASNVRTAGSAQRFAAGARARGLRGVRAHDAGASFRRMVPPRAWYRIRR